MIFHKCWEIRETKGPEVKGNSVKNIYEGKCYNIDHLPVQPFQIKITLTEEQKKDRYLKI